MTRLAIYTLCSESSRASGILAKITSVYNPAACMNGFIVTCRVAVVLKSLFRLHDCLHRSDRKSNSFSKFDNNRVKMNMSN